MLTKFDKALVAVVVPLAGFVVNYFTPETIDTVASYAGDFVTQAVLAALTGLLVYLTPNKK